MGEVLLTISRRKGSGKVNVSCRAKSSPGFALFCTDTSRSQTKVQQKQSLRASTGNLRNTNSKDTTYTTTTTITTNRVCTKRTRDTKKPG